MARRQPRRLEMLGRVQARKGADGHGHMRRPCPRGAGLGDGLSDFAGEDREPVDVGRLALIGRHAQRRVALELFDRAKAFLRGEGDIGCR